MQYLSHCAQNQAYLNSFNIYMLLKVSYTEL